MIHLTKISKQYGPRFLFKEADFQVRLADRIGLVGQNGAGKTTLFRIITGEEKVDSGYVSTSEKAIIGYFSQDVAEMKGKSALEEVKAGAGRVSEVGAMITQLEHKLAQSASTPLTDNEMTKLLDQYGEAQLEFEQRGGYDLDFRAQAILTGLGIGPDDYDREVESFSGGWKMRIALAKILTLNPDVLLMDEPTNHLDLESIVWLEEWLSNFKGALVMTSHDRDFMNRLVKRIVEVGNKTITSYSGNYDFYEQERDIRKNQLKAAHRKQQEMLSKEEEFIARFAARASHAAQVQSRIKKLEKIERIEIPPDDKIVKFEFSTPPRSGHEVVKLVEVSKIWTLPNQKSIPVFQGVSGVVKRLDRIALVGVNGAGKSTLLKCIAGLTEETSGDITHGANVQIGYFSQLSLDVLNVEKTLQEEIHDRIPVASIGYVRNLLGAFLFSDDDVHKKISVLSGGEKSRLILATLLATPVNFLILDEPTNHLDIKTREVLLKALQNFDGTLMLVSHDRHFLRSVTTRVFELHQGELCIYEGGYADYFSRSVKPMLS
jgi:ATP-binding cassette, subfamily F, member 3